MKVTWRRTVNQANKTQKQMLNTKRLSNTFDITSTFNYQ